jgi:type II secretory pathway component GspD/PulD (secretin)
MMRFHQEYSRRRPGRAALAALLAASMLLESSPASAQRRRGEPEANPDFQNQLQAPGAGGGPLGEASPGPLGGADEDEAPAPRNVQGVQIGAAAPSRAVQERSVAPLDTRVTVRVKGAPLATFLDTISAQAKVNFIITEGLESKRVTAFLQNVTVREALQVLLEIKGLTYQQIGKSNTYVVTPRSKQVENLITRIYTLNYIPLIPLGADTAGASLLTLGGGAQSGGMGGGTPQPSGAPGGAGPGGAAAGGGGGGASDSGSAISIVRVLRSVLSKSGHVELEPRTNALVVTDIPEVFPQVEQIIAELDKKAPQVMIEAQIVEIDSNRSRELGFEWGGTNGELGSFKGGARDTTFPLNMPRNVGNTQFFDPLSPSDGIKSALGSGGGSGNQNEESTDTILRNTGILLTSVVDLTALQITLRALVSRSEARFLGKPKILTLNNKSAVIQIGSMEALALQAQQSSAAGGGGSLQSVGAERQPTGLVLAVTPQINREGYITMLVQPSFTDIQEAAISRASQRVFNPIQRAASTLVRVKNGQTLVMGGLLRSTETKVVRKVPFFGYIPIIGWLFTSTSNRRVNSDLVIFLTPTIVSD